MPRFEVLDFKIHIQAQWGEPFDSMQKNRRCWRMGLRILQLLKNIGDDPEFGGTSRLSSTSTQPGGNDMGNNLY